MKPPRRPLLRRGLSMGLAALYVFGVFASLAHVAEVEHARCPEHGEAIHLPAGESLAGALAALTEARQDTEDALGAGERSEAHGGHEHCALLAPLQQQAWQASRQDSLASLSRAHFEALAAPEERATSSSLAVYRLAPKHGPPA